MPGTFFQKRLVDMIIKEIGITVVVGIILVVAGVLAWNLSKPSSPKEIYRYKEGKPDTSVAKGKSDTVYVPRYYEKIVQVPAEKITKYGEDSSRVDTTLLLDNGKLTLGVTTYPAIESLKLNIDLLTVTPEITRIDTLKIFQLDSIWIAERIEPAWYETWWFGSLVTAVVALTAIISGR